VLQCGGVVKAQATKEPAPNPRGAGGQNKGRAAPVEAQPKPGRTGAPVVVPQPPQTSTLTLLPPTTESVTTRAIIDFLDNLHTSAFVELTRRLLSPASSLPTGDARPRAVLKTFILFFAEHGGTAQEDPGYSLVAGLLER
jgi:hypothetical protein